MRYCGFRLATSGSRANNTPRLIPNPPKCRPIAPKRPIFNCFHPMGLQFGGNTTSNRDLSTSQRGKWRHLRRDPAGSRLFAPCIDSPLAQPPLAPTTPTKPTTLTKPDGTPPASRTYVSPACRSPMVAIPPRQQEQTRQQGTTARITPVREHYTTMRDATVVPQKCRT